MIWRNPLRSLTLRLTLGYMALFTVSVGLMLAITFVGGVWRPLRAVEDRIRTQSDALVAVYDSTLALLVQAEVASRLDARAEAGEFASAFEAAWPRENLPRSLRERLATVR